MTRDAAADQPATVAHRYVWPAIPRLERVAVAVFLTFAATSLALGAVMGISTAQTDGAASLGLYLFVGCLGAVVGCILAAEIFYAQACVLEDRLALAHAQDGVGRG